MRTAILVFVAAAIGCSRDAPSSGATDDAPKPPSIAGVPVTMRLKQRTTVPIPGSEGRVSLALDDITRDQVKVSVVKVSMVEGASTLLGPLSMRGGDRSTFALDGTTFEVELTQLADAVVGSDYATFTVRYAPGEAPKLTQAQKIERIIDSVEALQGATFLRNGDEHSAADAAVHLRRKRDAGGKDVATVEQFIENAGTRSSLSGKDYEIRFADGRTVRLADFLREEAAKLDS